jgi:hypothetical protein
VPTNGTKNKNNNNLCCHLHNFNENSYLEELRENCVLEYWLVECRLSCLQLKLLATFKIATSAVPLLDMAAILGT